MFSVPLVFLMYMSNQMDVFYFTHKTMFLTSAIIRGIILLFVVELKKKMEVQLIFTFFDI